MRSADLAFASTGKTPRNAFASSPARQRLQLVTVAAPENDVIGLERGDQTIDYVLDVAPPLPWPVPLQSVQSDVLLADSIPVRQIVPSLDAHFAYASTLLPSGRSSHPELYLFRAPPTALQQSPASDLFTATPDDY